MTPSSRQLRRSGRLNVIVVIGPPFSTGEFSVIWLGALHVAFLRRSAPVQLFSFFTLSLFRWLARQRPMLNNRFFQSLARRGGRVVEGTRLLILYSRLCQIKSHHGTL